MIMFVHLAAELWMYWSLITFSLLCFHFCFCQIFILNIQMSNLFNQTVVLHLTHSITKKTNVHKNQQNQLCTKNTHQTIKIWSCNTSFTLTPLVYCQPEYNVGAISLPTSTSRLVPSASRDSSPCMFPLLESPISSPTTKYTSMGDKAFC